MSDRWRRIEDLFIAAGNLPPAEQSALLARECDGDEALRREVEDLLALDAEEGVSLVEVVDEAAQATVTRVESRKMGQHVGPYRLERELGSGGMGSVFLGVRDDDTYRKHVAIKLMRFGVHRDDMVRRFRNERQILATLEHRYIARLLDGGTTPSGEPYVIMEYVEGHPILDHCRQADLDLRGRLELFLKVCEAVHYAHERGIIHRDIKPGNVLVNAEGEPRLLDFGIAKLLDASGDPDLSVTQPVTQTSMRLLTPQYASPEQLRGESVTLATDLYSLGVLLYRLLTDRLPHSADDRDPLKLERHILEDSPDRPSLAVQREVATAVASRDLMGDLDTIVLTALRKDPLRRYASVADFAADIRRHLAGMPIRARPAGWGYRLKKFIRRKPVHTALATVLLVTLPILGILGMRERTRQREALGARVDELHETVRWLAEKRRYDEMEIRIDELLKLDAKDPYALAHRVLRSSYVAAQVENGIERSRHLEEAIGHVDRLVSAAPDLAWLHTLRAYLLEQSGRTEAAVQASALAMKRRTDPPGEDDLDFEARLAVHRGDFESAFDLLTQLIRRRPDRAAAIAARAYVYEELGDPDAALSEYRIAAGIDPTQGLTMVDIARLSLDKHRLDDAEAFLDRAFELKPDSGFAHETRGHLLLSRGLEALSAGTPKSAVSFFEQAERVTRRALALEPELRWAQGNITASLVLRYPLIEPRDDRLLENAVGVSQQFLARWSSPPAGGEELDAYVAVLANRCEGLIRLSRLAEAIENCGQAIELSPGQSIPHYNLAGAHALMGSKGEAVAALEASRRLGDNDWNYLLRDPWFESLRADTRFLALVERMKNEAP